MRQLGVSVTGRAGQPRLEPGLVPRHQILQRRQQDLLLVPEVVVNQAGREAGGPRHVGD